MFKVRKPLSLDEKLLRQKRLCRDLTEIKPTYGNNASNRKNSKISKFNEKEGNNKTKSVKENSEAKRTNQTEDVSQKRSKSRSKVAKQLKKQIQFKEDIEITTGLPIASLKYKEKLQKTIINRLNIKSLGNTAKVRFPDEKYVRVGDTSRTFYNSKQEGTRKSRNYAKRVNNVESFLRRVKNYSIKQDLFTKRKPRLNAVSSLPTIREEYELK